MMSKIIYLSILARGKGPLWNRVQIVFAIQIEDNAQRWGCFSQLLSLNPTFI